jgi:hypothetical protein
VISFPLLAGLLRSLLFGFPQIARASVRKGFMSRAVSSELAFSIRFSTLAQLSHGFFILNTSFAAGTNITCASTSKFGAVSLERHFTRLKPNIPLFVARLEHVLLFFCGSVTGFEDLRYSSPAFKSAYQLMKICTASQFTSTKTSQLQPLQLQRQP